MKCWNDAMMKDETGYNGENDDSEENALNNEKGENDEQWDWSKWWKYKDCKHMNLHQFTKWRHDDID